LSALATAIVTMLTSLLPLITGSGSSTITTIINTLIQLIPLVTSEIAALATPIKNIIAALSANPATTAEQLATLQALDAQVDAAFEAAATAAGEPAS
jgi:phage-related protein